MDVDILIVGLGPAGATVLSKLSQLLKNEYSILAIDKRTNPGFPVQCGEYMPSPEEMAILMPNVPNPYSFFKFDKKFISTELDKISFYSPFGKIVKCPFKGYTIHRGKWNAHLIDEGIKNGAEVWTSTIAKGLKNGTVLVSRKGKENIRINSKVIIGADGPKSVMARSTGMVEKRSLEDFVYVKQHTMFNITSEQFSPTEAQLFFGEEYSPGAYAWLFPKDNTSANVGVGIRKPILKNNMTISRALDNLINKHPYVSKMLNGAEIKQTISGIVPVCLPLKKTVDLNTNVVLVGDASYQVVSSVGAGIPPSMVAGTIAAQSIVEFLQDNEPLMKYHYEWQSQMLETFKKAYILRRFFDKISTGKDTRFQWYMNRLTPSIVDDILHCRIPLKLTFVNPFISILNKFIK